MSTLEILAKAAAKTPRYDLFESGHGDLTWQDVLQALQGVSLAKTSFALFLITDDKTCRHYFWAGLFMDVMQHWWLREWSDRHVGAVQGLCRIAVSEWGDGKRYSDTKRAELMGVSRGTWYRKYRDVYPDIYEIPKEWQLELEQLLRQRLR